MSFSFINMKFLRKYISLIKFSELGFIMFATVITPAEFSLNYFLYFLLVIRNIVKNRYRTQPKYGTIINMFSKIEVGISVYFFSSKPGMNVLQVCKIHFIIEPGRWHDKFSYDIRTADYISRIVFLRQFKHGCENSMVGYHFNIYNRCIQISKLDIAKFLPVNNQTV